MKACRSFVLSVRRGFGASGMSPVSKISNWIYVVFVYTAIIALSWGQLLAGEYVEDWDSGFHGSISNSAHRIYANLHHWGTVPTNRQTFSYRGPPPATMINRDYIAKPPQATSYTQTANSIRSTTPSHLHSLPVVEDYAEFDVMSVIAKSPDLKGLNEFMASTGAYATLGNSRLIKRIKMTAFVPSTDAMKKARPAEIMEAMKNLNLQQRATNIINSHLHLGKQLEPNLLNSEEEFFLPSRGHKTSITIKRLPSGVIVVDNSAKVVKIIRAKNGIIYVIDTVLTPRYNDGPFLKKLLELPEFSILEGLLQSSGILSKLDAMGPLTVLLLPNSGFFLPNGEPLPQCGIDGLKRPENRRLLFDLITYMAFPELVTSEEMMDHATLLPLNGDPVEIARQRRGPESDIISVNGVEILESDIPIHNGVRFSNIIGGAIFVACSVGKCSVYVYLCVSGRSRSRKTSGSQGDRLGSRGILGLPRRTSQRSSTSSSTGTKTSRRL
eukprot:GHVT01042445.1.p1 GENE.GHVT01042445.1~~GHVT01042445.1.p1  ORF type:complete len:497 (-),score=8.94 GHVT01042445.1:1882-3372(-)